MLIPYFLLAIVALGICWAIWHLCHPPRTTRTLGPRDSAAVWEEYLDRLEQHKEEHLATIPPLDRELMEAVWNGDANRVTELIRAGANVECFDHMTNTPLHLAVEQLNVQIAEILLDAGAAVNGRTASGSWAPLAHAAETIGAAASNMERQPDNEMLRLLLRHGAEVNATTSDGESALSFCQTYRNVEGEAILITAGATKAGK